MTAMNTKPQACRPNSATKCLPCRPYRPQRGFSLIELMIAITMSLLIMLALIALFLNMSRGNTEMAKTNNQIENGRFAMQILQNDIIHAGFWGEYVPQFDDLTTTTVPTDVPTDVPDPCLVYTSWDTAYKNTLIGIPIQAYDSAPAGCAVVSHKKTSSDVLVVRHAETCLPGGDNCEADTTGKLNFQTSLCELENATPYKLDTTGFTLHKRDCVGTGSPPVLPITAGTIADKRKFISKIYYIRDYAVTPGDGIPTLMRSQFDLSGTTLAHQAAVPLIEGIEGFNVEFGIDSFSDSVPPTAVNYGQAIAWADSTNKTSPTNRGDGIPDGTFVHCTTATPCTFDKLTNVVAVKLYVLARAREATAGYIDTKTYALGSTTLGPFTGDQAKYKRHVFSTTVRLVNIAGRRETP